MSDDKPDSELTSLTNRAITTKTLVSSTDHEAWRNDIEGRVDDQISNAKDNSNHRAGTSAPTDNTVEGQIWCDTTSDPAQLYADLDGSGADTAMLGLVPIETQTASADATIDFTTGINSVYDSYVLVLSGVVPATDNQSLHIRISVDGGSTWVATSTYRYTTTSRQDGGTNAVTSTTTGTTFGISGQNVGSASGEHVNGHVEVFAPASAGLFTSAAWRTVYVDADGAANFADGGGMYSVAAAIDGLQIFFNTGNITSGKFTLYGRYRA